MKIFHLKHLEFRPLVEICDHPPPRDAILWRSWATGIAEIYRRPEKPRFQTSTQIRRGLLQATSKNFRKSWLIYTAESITNCTKPHRIGPLTRPRTLLEQGAKWCISGTNIQGLVSISSLLAFQSTNSKSSKQVGFTFVSTFARRFSTCRDFRIPQGGNSYMLFN